MTDFNTTPENIHQSRIVGLPDVAPRKLKHRRTFCYEVYEREDGLWDIDAQMLDHKSSDITVANQVRPVGEPLHDMVLRITLDQTLTIVAAQAMTLNAPYMTQCPSINPDYAQLVGLNVLRGFRKAVKDLFAQTAGCTHITELANTLPTVAIQGVGTELAQRRRLKNAEVGETGEKPFQLDQCHALSSDGEVARIYYPKWYTGQ